MSKNIRFATIINGNSTVRPPLKIPYELWEEDSQKWEKYDSDGVCQDKPCVQS